MRALGRGSLASALRILLDVLRIVLCVILAFATVLAAAFVYVYAAGSADNVFGVPVERNGLWYVMALEFALVIGALVAALLVVSRLRRIFATLSAGDPFVPENADHLRIIAIVIAVFEAARLVMSGVRASVMPAATDAAADVATDAASGSGLEVNFLVWFAVLSLVVLSEVFREGARLRADQQLTI